MAGRPISPLPPTPKEYTEREQFQMRRTIELNFEQIANSIVRSYKYIDRDASRAAKRNAFLLMGGVSSG